MTKGAPVDDPNLQFNAYYRLKIKRGQWMYAPNTNYGSDLFKLKKNVTTKPQVLVENIAARALKPIIDDGRALAIDVTVNQVARIGVGLQVDIQSAQAQTTTLNLTGIGTV